MERVTNYVDYLWSIRDRRVDGWFLVDSPVTNLAICGFYVVFVTKIGPYLMRDRKPFQLKALLQAYNLFQVVFSTYMVIKSCKRAWFNHYSWICQPVEIGTAPDSSAMVMVNLTWLYFLNKYAEFADTLFFVARKKYNQVTPLHVYHHAIMPLYAFMQARWLPGGHEILAGVINTAVHVLMYTYYLLAACGPKIQPYLWWKKYITKIQLAQFVFCFLHSFIVAFRFVECGYPWQVSLGSMAFLHVPFFYMFANFYIKTYKKSNGYIKKD